MKTHDSDVYIADLKTGASSVFTSGRRDSDPRWSRDGRSILFTSRRNLGKDDKGQTMVRSRAGLGM